MSVQYDFDVFSLGQRGLHTFVRLFGCFFHRQRLGRMSHVRGADHHMRSSHWCELTRNAVSVLGVGIYGIRVERRTKRIRRLLPRLLADSNFCREWLVALFR